MAAAGQSAHVDSEPFITRLLNQISYMDYFHQTLAQIRIWALSNNQDGCQNGRHLSFCSCGQDHLVMYLSISSKFHLLITFMKLSPKFKYGF